MYLNFRHFIFIFLHLFFSSSWGYTSALSLTFNCIFKFFIFIWFLIFQLFNSQYFATTGRYIYLLQLLVVHLTLETLFDDHQSSCRIHYYIYWFMYFLYIDLKCFALQLVSTRNLFFSQLLLNLIHTKAIIYFALFSTANKSIGDKCLPLSRWWLGMCVRCVIHY